MRSVRALLWPHQRKRQKPGPQCKECFLKAERSRHVGMYLQGLVPSVFSGQPQGTCKLSPVGRGDACRKRLHYITVFKLNIGPCFYGSVSSTYKFAISSFNVLLFFPFVDTVLTWDLKQRKPWKCLPLINPPPYSSNVLFCLCSNKQS